MDDFEAAFSDYLDSQEGDAAEDALFTILRTAFRAGWRAAGAPDPSGKSTDNRPENAGDRKVIHLDRPAGP